MLLFLLSCQSTPADTGVPAESPQTADTSADAEEHGADTSEPEDTRDPFMLEAWTEDTSPGLQLYTNLPPAPGDCALLRDAPCADLDSDGLVDAWEGVVLERLRPLVMLDEDEPLLVDPGGLLIHVARIWPITAEEVRVMIVLAYSEDNGRCGLTAHPGDSERVALTLTLHSGSAWVTEAYTAAHEGELNDQSTLYAGEDIRQMETTTDPTTGEPRWLVYASEGKHATYASTEHCEEVSIIPCLEEDCAPDGVSDKARYSVLGAHALNAGEEAHPLADDLAEFGMTGERIWADQPFCGGLGRAHEADCSSGLLEKMRTDPLE